MAETAPLPALEPALRASGAHVISDFWTSAGVIVGLGVTELTGWTWLDSVMAFLVGLWLGFTGLKLMFESIGGLSIVHNYGHGAHGWTIGHATAELAAAIAMEKTG